MNRRSIALVLAILLLPASLVAKQKEFAETTSVILVEVPVNVIKDGDPVRGLTKESFEVYDGRKKVDILDFEVIDLSMVDQAAKEEKPAPVPMAARRHFLLLFDLSYAMPKSILKARRAAQETVLEDLHPTDLVAVATYATNSGPQLILSFTPDRRQVELALDTLGAPNILDLQPDPLGIILGDPYRLPGADTDTGPSSSREGRAEKEALLEEHLQDMYRASAASQRQEERKRVQALTSAFTGLANLMASVEGRKHVVYFSEGFDSSLMLGTSNQDERDQMAASAASGEIWNVSSQDRFGDTGTINDLEAMIEAFRRADCAVQSVDIGGLDAGGDLQARNYTNDSMVAMAKDTGGEFYENFNDLGTAMGEVLQRTSVTYLLSFQPRDLELDGEYHRLKVKLVGGPSGADLQHRPGYYAPRPYAEQAGAQHRLAASQQVLSGDEGGTVEISALASPFRIENEPAYVPVFVEVDGPSLMGGIREGTLGIELYAYAMTPQGTVADFFSQQVGLNLDQVASSLEQGGVKLYGHLDLPPGDYSLRIMARNAATGASALRNVALTVPEWSQRGPVVLPALFPEPMGRWIMVREGEAEQKERSVAYPFMAGQAPFIPAADPVVSAAQPGTVWIPVYNLSSDQLQIQARVLDESGREVEAKLGGFGLEPGTQGGVSHLTAQLPGGLAPGSYRLEMTIADPASGGTGSATTPFQVVR